ncbi:heterokaryon incompatibility protein-domain-containing protein [Circinella umbellata]|nr:heterokaryon incompatibility protein-domain-containing protein [Circinella umbellata]
MYITYCRNQSTVNLKDKTDYRLNLTGGDYRPTWLIRVSDWKKVPGEEAVHGYHTISYSWEQSGKVVPRNDGSGEYDLIDHGKHCIVEDYNLYYDGIINSTLKDDTHVTWCQPESEGARIRDVTYNQLLQQLCKDFQVDYVWYDKLCINQSDSKAKSYEIKQMHKIYRNARYTIVMIPEAVRIDQEDFQQKIIRPHSDAPDQVIDAIMESSWWKRSWTLEEVMMSKNILIVGTDINFFQHSLHTTEELPTTVDLFSNILLDFGSRGNNGTVNQGLAFAHFRTSTKSHDMIFALKNTFSDMFDEMEINYAADIKKTFHDFYRHIGTKDLSILCFGSALLPDGDRGEYQSTVQNYNLPSWTGVAGKHIQIPTFTTIHHQLTHAIDDTMKMHIKTKRYWEIDITPYEGGCYSSIPRDDKYNGKVGSQIVRINMASAKRDRKDMGSVDKNTILEEYLATLNTTTCLLMTHYHHRQGDPAMLLRPLSLTEDCKKCIILPILLTFKHATHQEVEMNGNNVILGEYDFGFCLPVVRQSTTCKNRYKAIGVYYVGIAPRSKVDSPIQWNHLVGIQDVFTYEPEEIVNSLFENDFHSNEPKEFIIE